MSLVNSESFALSLDVLLIAYLKVFEELVVEINVVRIHLACVIRNPYGLADRICRQWSRAHEVSRYGIAQRRWPLQVGAITGVAKAPQRVGIGAVGLAIGVPTAFEIRSISCSFLPELGSLSI